MLNVERCRGCGGELRVDGAEVVVVCPFCGHRRWVEEQERAARAGAAGAAELEREASAALRDATLLEARAHARSGAFVAGAALASPAVAAAVASTYLELEPPWAAVAHGVVVLSAGAALLAGGVAALLLFQPARIDARVRRRLADVEAALGRRPPGGKCPSCGGAVQAAAPGAVFECAFCRAPLCYAHGVLIAWSADTRQRAERWKWRAFDDELSASLWPWPTWVAFTVLLVAFASALRSLGELAFLL